MRKVVLSISAILTLLVLLTCAVSAGFIAGQRMNPLTGLPQFSSTPPGGAELTSTTTTSEAFTPFWEAWDIVHKYYVDQPVNDVLLVQGAIRGMVAALGDQHSSYQDPGQMKEWNTQLSGEYEGIGAYVNTDGEYLTISEPIPGSPAEKAGLLPGDQIIAIDGVDMTGTLPEVARQKVLGPKGSLVKLTIRREGVKEPFTVEIQRESIKIASVEGKMLDGNIAYVKISNFGEQTETELRTTLEDLLAQKPSGLILDLRNNPGGYLNTAVSVASEFLKDGVVVTEEYGDGKRNTRPVIQGGMATEVPLVVLVNEYSASASEVVAGAIQDSGRGILIGVTTYGKGSVQQVMALSNDQGAVRVTVAHWLTPKDRLINGIGLTPDKKVDMTEEDYKNKVDPQLDAALGYFK